MKKTELNRRIPIIADIPAGEWRHWYDAYAAGVGDDYISVPYLKGEDLFALRVYGDSMEPTLHEGDILIIDPNKTFRKGIAIVRHNKKYCVRNVHKLSSKKYLLISHNLKYEDEEITVDNYTKLFVPIKVISMRDLHGIYNEVAGSYHRRQRFYY